jgi:hypothetical protein
MMRRIMMLVTVALVMALIMAFGMGAAFADPPETHPLISGDHPLIRGDCGQGNCTGFGFDDNPGEDQNDATGDQANEHCEDHGVCIGTFNN